MPWCEDCAKFWNPNTVPADGTCPTCHRPIAGPPSDRAVSARPERTAVGAETASTVVDDDEGRTKVPWHFWVMVACVALYLGWRVVQLLGWAVQGIVD